MVLMLFMFLANGGYLAIALSTNVQEAILANRVCYLGGCFIPPITLFWVCFICNIKVPRWLKNLLYLYSFIVYGMTLTIGYNDFYYKEVYLDKLGDATVLGRTYGIGHMFFVLLLYGYIGIQIVLVIYSLLKKHTTSRKNLWILVSFEIVNISMFIMGKTMNPMFEIMSFMYIVDSCFFLYIHHRSTKYNIEDSINNSFRRQDMYGYIMFDKGLNYLGCNIAAQNIFPELKKCVVDKPLQNIAGLTTVAQHLKVYAETEEAGFTYGDGTRHYECSIEKVVYKRKVCGYMVELVEDTEKWKYVNLMSTYNTELEQLHVELEKKVEEQTQELRIQQKTIKDLFIQTVTALSEAVDAKDRYTSGHSKRVAEYSRMIAARMGKSKEEQEEIYRAGLLHDVGKIRIPVEIINKAGKLTDEEYNIIKIHPVTGYHILRGISGSNFIAIGAKYHHERYDGKGYPNGLAGDKIPEMARILGVADSYDAMTSNRSYRKALPQEVVRSEIEKGKGTQFDPDIADIMLQMIDEDKDYTMKQTDSMFRMILAVDDEEMNHKILTHIMRDEPMYKIVSAKSGREALKVLEQQTFDLILLDMNMPEIDGLETLRLIRESYQTPVALMTGDKTIDMSIEFADLGCDEYITKPFLPLMIKEIVHNMTERTSIVDN